MLVREACKFANLRHFRNTWNLPQLIPKPQKTLWVLPLYMLSGMTSSGFRGPVRDPICTTKLREGQNILRSPRQHFESINNATELKENIEHTSLQAWRINHYSVSPRKRPLSLSRANEAFIVRQRRKKNIHAEVQMIRYLLSCTWPAVGPKTMRISTWDVANTVASSVALFLRLQR